MLSAIRELLIKLLRKLGWRKNNYCLQEFLKIKMRGYISINGQLLTEDDIDETVYEKMLEKKKRLYLNRIKEIITNALRE